MLEQAIMDKLESAKEIQTIQVTSEVSEKGRSEIFRLLSSRYGSISTELWKHSTWADFNWQNADASGQTIAKRISTRLYKYHHVKVKPNDLTEVGNLAEQYGMSMNRVCYFSVSDNVHLKRGEFGDSGSCFYDDRKHALVVLQHNGAMSLLFRDSEGKGIGRCWLIKSDYGLLLFNSYGQINSDDDAKQTSGASSGRKDASLLKMAMVLGAYLGLECTKTRLTINGSLGDPVYINREATSDAIPGGNAVLLSPKASTISLIDVPMDDPTLFICDSCNSGNRGESLDDVGFKTTPKGVLCSACFSRHYIFCISCKEVKDKETCRPISYEGYGCKECLQSGRLPKCAHCGGYNLRSNTLHTDDNKPFCRGCFSSKVVECNCCTRKFNISLMNRNGICPICVDERRRTRKVVEKMVGTPLNLRREEINPEEAVLFTASFYRQLKEFSETASQPDAGGLRNNILCLHSMRYAYMAPVTFTGCLYIIRSVKVKSALHATVHIVINDFGGFYFFHPWCG